MNNKYFEIIYHLDKENYIKWWLLKHYRSVINRIIALKQITPLTLNGTILHKLLQIIIYGKTEQDGTPTPETPVEIKNVEGKNKFDKNNPNALKLYPSGGSNMKYISSSEYLSVYIPITGGKTYTVSREILSNRFSLATSENIPASNGPLIEIAQNNTAYSLTITTTENANYLCVYLTTDGSNFNEVLDKLQIEEGSVASPYVPYNSIGVKTQNANLWDRENSYISNSSSGNKSYKLDFDANKYSWVKNMTSLTLSADYQKNGDTRTNPRIELNINYTDGTDYYTRAYLTETSGHASTTITYPGIKEISKLVIRLMDYSANPDNVWTLSVNNIMLNVGTTEKSFVLHAEQNKYFTFEEGQYLAEGGYLADDGIHNVLKKYVFTGQEGFNYGAGQLITDYFKTIIKKPATNGTIANIKADIFKAVAKYYSENVNSIAVDVSGNIYMNNPAWQSLAEGEAGIVGTVIQYELAEEIITPYTPTQQAQWNAIKNMYTYKDQTNINVLANLDGIEIDIGYYGTSVISQETLEELSNGRGD